MRISDWSSYVCSSDLSVAASIFELNDGRHELVEFLDGIRGEKFIAQHADAFVELAGGVGLVRVDLEDELLAFVEFDIGMDQRVDRAEALCVLCIDLFCDLGPNAPIIGEGEFHLVVEQLEPVADRIWVRGIGRRIARTQANANGIVLETVAMVSPKR